MKISEQVRRPPDGTAYVDSSSHNRVMPRLPTVLHRHKEQEVSTREATPPTTATRAHDPAAAGARTPRHPRISPADGARSHPCGSPAVSHESEGRDGRAGRAEAVDRKSRRTRRAGAAGGVLRISISGMCAWRPRVCRSRAGGGGAGSTDGGLRRFRVADSACERRGGKGKKTGRVAGLLCCLGAVSRTGGSAAMEFCTENTIVRDAVSRCQRPPRSASLGRQRRRRRRQQRCKPQPGRATPRHPGRSARSLTHVRPTRTPPRSRQQRSRRRTDVVRLLPLTGRASWGTYLRRDRAVSAPPPSPPRRGARHRRRGCRLPASTRTPGAAASPAAGACVRACAMSAGDDRGRGVRCRTGQRGNETVGAARQGDACCEV